MKLRAGLVLLLSVLVAADVKDHGTKNVTATRERTTTKEDMAKLQGTWIFVAGEHGGEKARELENQIGRLLIKGEKVIIGGGAFEVTFKLNAMKEPKTIDMTVRTPNAVIPGLGIYHLDGDKLKICLEFHAKHRPREFMTTQGSPAVMVFLKREKK